MSLKDLIQTGVSVVIALGIVVGGVGYFISVWKKSNRQENKEVVSSSDQLTGFWKEQVDGFKAIVADQTEKIRILTGQIGELKGQLLAEKAQNDSLKLIFQNRNPEMEQFMKHMVQAAKDQAESYTEIARVLKDIHSTVANEHKQDLNITAQITKTDAK